MGDEPDLGKSLMTIGFIVFMLPFWLEMMELWFLFIVGIALFVVGIVIKASRSGDSMGRTSAVGINPFLPTSRGVDFLEKVVGFADNPDTSTLPVGAQPVGTHPTMLGISSNEFISETESYDGSSNQADFSHESQAYTGSSNRRDFVSDEYNEFTEHGHERVLPIELRDPASYWHNPVDEWQNPTKYW